MEFIAGMVLGAIVAGIGLAAFVLRMAGWWKTR